MRGRVEVRKRGMNKECGGVGVCGGKATKHFHIHVGSFTLLGGHTRRSVTAWGKLLNLDA